VYLIGQLSEPYFHPFVAFSTFSSPRLPNARSFVDS